MRRLIFVSNFAAKNAMFSLYEYNRIVMAQHPADVRMGVNCMRVQVRSFELDPTNGEVYIFIGRTRKVMKILHWENGVMYYKRPRAQLKDYQGTIQTDGNEVLF